MPYPVAAARGRAPLSSAFSPLSLSPVAWYDFSDLSALFQDAARTTPAVDDGDPVGGVTDKSGSGNHLSQATSSKRPVLKLAVQNGRAVLRFDGVDDFLANESGVLVGGNFPANTATLSVVYRLNGTQARYGITATGSTATGHWRFADGAGYFNDFRNGRLEAYPAAMPDSGSCIASVVAGSGSGNYRVYLNGVNQGAKDPSWGITSLFQLGVDSFGNQLSGDICEVLVFGSALVDGDRSTVEAYENGRWGIY